MVLAPCLLRFQSCSERSEWIPPGEAPLFNFQESVFLIPNTAPGQVDAVPKIERIFANARTKSEGVSSPRHA